MKNKSRKDLEKEINSAVEKILNAHHKVAATFTKKNLKSFSKDVSKKFHKELKKLTVKKEETKAKVKSKVKVKEIVPTPVVRKRGRPRKK